MKLKLFTAKAVLVLVGFLCGVLLTGLIYFAGLQGLYTSNPYFALAQGREITGVIESKGRTLGFSFTVTTSDFGVLQVTCTPAQYKELQVGDTIILSCDLTILE